MKKSERNYIYQRSENENSKKSQAKESLFNQDISISQVFDSSQSIVLYHCAGLGVKYVYLS